MNSDIKLRKTLFGGFRKKDVLNYVEQLNSDSEERISELKAKLVSSQTATQPAAQSEAHKQAEQIKEQNAALEASVAELKSEIGKMQAQLDEANAAIKKLESEKEYAFSTVASTQAELIRTKEIARQNAVIVVEQSDGSRDVLSLDELLQEIRSYRMVASALRENSRRLTESLNKQMDFADNCIESLTKTKK